MVIRKSSVLPLARATRVWKTFKSPLEILHFSGMEGGQMKLHTEICPEDPDVTDRAGHITQKISTRILLWTLNQRSPDVHKSFVP